MNLRSLTVRDRRALTLGYVAFAPMLSWLLIIAPYTRHLGETRDRLDRSTELLRRELRIVGSARQYAAARIEAQRRLEESRPRLIYATSDVSARATLVGFVDERARASNIEVAAVDATGDSTQVGALRRVSVRVSGTGDMEGILTLIGALESGSPFLAVTQLEIEAGTPSTGATEALAFRLVASGFRAAGESERITIVGSTQGAAR
jgi:type II secretory pathway component PulM